MSNILVTGLKIGINNFICFQADLLNFDNSKTGFINSSSS